MSRLLGSLSDKKHFTTEQTEALRCNDFKRLLHKHLNLKILSYQIDACDFHMFLTFE